MANEADTRLTVVVARRIRAGKEAEYERAMVEFINWSLAQAGHEGLHVLRPGPGERDYTVISRFRDEPARRAFTSSAEYASWMARLAALTEGAPRIQELSGLEGFVSLPGHELRRPPSWKLASATFIGVLPTSIAVGLCLGPLTKTWPFLLSSAAFAAAMVTILTWIVMPLVTRALHGWLFPERANAGTK